MTRIAFTGDIALSGIISQFSEAQVREQLFLGKVSDETVFIINLEVPVASENDVSSKNRGVKLRSSNEVLKAFLRNNKIAAITLANNHITDYGPEGLNQTIQILNSFNIPHTGAGLVTEHTEPAIFQTDTIRYALISYVHPGTHPSITGDTNINIYNKQKIISDIQKIRKSVDFVLLSVHWGKDYSMYPQSWQINDAHDFIREGADIIVGHHPHVIQPFELYNGRFIFYSLGSMIFGDFSLRGRLRALPVKTKRSFIPVFTNIQHHPELISICELKGNSIALNSKNILRWSEFMMRRTRLKNKNRFYSSLLDFKEEYLDRIFDVLFGYYRNPFKDLFNIEAIRNGIRIIRKKRSHK